MSSNATPTTTTTTISNAPTTSPVQPPLPPPQTFDILPPLHALLSRLEPSLNVYTPDTSAPNPGPTTTTTNNPSSNPSTDNTQTLAYKDLATASQFLKSRIRKAMQELGGLADMDRSIEEQEEEISMLEQRIEGQKDVLRRLGVVAEEKRDGV